MPPTTARLCWGILGVANNNKRVLTAFARSTHAELHAIANRSLERARAAAAAGIPTAYGSYEQLLEDPAIDAVYIRVPNAMIETVPLDQAANAYAKMMAGKARFRIVLTMHRSDRAR
jgi:hypothetical protein